VPTVIERLTANVSTGGLEQRLAAQVGALQQAIALAGPLIDGKTPDVSALIGRLGALRSPAFDAGAFAAALGRANDLIPADLASVVEPVGGRFAEMAALVDERLRPLLQDAVKSAQAIQQLINLRVGCPGGNGAGSGGAASPPPPPPSTPGAPAPPGRVAVAAQQIAQLEAVLSGLPTPIDARALVQLVLTLLGSKSRDSFFALNLPVIDDLLDPLHTLIAWSGLDAAGVAAHMVTSVDTLSLRVREAVALCLAELGSRLDAQAPQWRVAALVSAADAVANGLTVLETALQTSDETAATAALAVLSSALDGYDALRVAMNGDVLAAVPALRAEVARTPAELLERLSHLLVLLESTSVATRVTSLIPPVQPVPPEAVEAVRDAVEPLIDWLHDLVALLDLGAVQAQVAEVATAAQTLAADIESGLTGVAVGVQSAFAEVGEAVAAIGLDDLRDHLTAQIGQFGEQVRRDVAQAFAPARAGTSAAIGAVSEALDTFDPAEITAALHEVVDGIAGVLSGPEVKGAIDEVRQAIDTVVEALRSLSFAPVTDEVAALIEAMRKGVQAIIDKDLNDATKAALGSAMSVLPGDLRPVTDPLVADFDQLVTAGPLALLNRVKDAPKVLLDEVKRFAPAALVGDRLSAPYRTLLARTGTFSAAALFAAADAELERARRRLVQTARPGRTLESLRPPLQQLFAKLDAFSASTLLAPLTDEVERTIVRIVAASPVDEILDAVNGVFDTVRDVLAFAERIRAVADGVRQVFEAFADADAQLDAWRDEVVAKVTAGAGAPLQDALAALSSALDGARHPAALAAFDGATAAVLGELAAIDPAARLNRIVVAYGRVATRVAALPASATRAAAEQALARFNPTQPAHSAPLRLAGEFRAAITAARGQLVALAGEWTETVDGFADLRDVAAGTVGGLISTAIDPALQPVRFVFQSLGNLVAPVKGVALTLSDLVTTLTARVDALVSGPGSLSAISDAIQDVVDALRNIDLGFVGRGLDDALQAVRDQLRAIDPARLADELDAAFAQALSGLSIGAVVPAAELAALDAAWQAVIEKLRGLDPGTLVEQTLQPIYDETVVPLLDAFDLTALFAGLIELLERLRGELADGFNEINGAYQSLIALRPGGGSVTVNVGATA
jgi:hypothetical protein